MLYRIIFTLLITLLFCFASAENQQTTITFFVEEDPEQDQDFIEITLVVRSEEQSLTNAVRKSNGIVEKVKSVANKACEKNADDEDCEDFIEVGNFQIEARYQLIRKVKTFVSFIVTHEVTISVLNSIPLGQLVDDLLDTGIYKIESMDWLPNEEKDSAIDAFASALEQGKKVCKDIGQKFQKIVSITEEEEEQEEQAAAEGEQQQQQEEEQEEEEPPVAYSVQVLCVPKEPKQEAGAK